MTADVVLGGRAPATIAFDRLAPEYDALAGGEIFAQLRRRTHDVFARHFVPGSQVLEIGCGTGIDACFLASRGVRVVACDPSEEMASRSLRRLAHHHLEQHAKVIPCRLQDLQSFLDALGEPDAFDGIVSNFGALNCIEHLAALGALVRRYLKPGGSLVLVVMTRLCVMEALYFTATWRPRLALRRLGAGGVAVDVAGVAVPTFYHRIADVGAALGRGVTLRKVEGIGVAIPPPYLERRWQALPKRVRGVVTSADALLAAWPPFNRLGDHVLLHFVKDIADA